MTDVLLGQEWISRVTTSEESDISVVGGSKRRLPEIGELKGVLHSLASSDTAREIARRKWLHPKDLKDKVEERGEALFDFVFARHGGNIRPAHAMFRGRRADAHRSLIAEISTMAWIIHVTDTAKSLPCEACFRVSNISEQFVWRLAKLSVHDDGPRRALEELRSIGINVVVESGLPGMSIDGASFHKNGVGPVIALTVRYDRLDNFWFTLMHELGHIALHLTEPSDQVFVDSIEDAQGDNQEAEAEADAFAKDSLIPRDTWLRSDVRRLGNESSVVSLARQLGIHPAIVAGRVRYERKEFRIFTDLVGIDRVREIIFQN